MLKRRRIWLRGSSSVPNAKGLHAETCCLSFFSQMWYFRRQHWRVLTPLHSLSFHWSGELVHHWHTNITQTEGFCRWGSELAHLHRVPGCPLPPAVPAAPPCACSCLCPSRKQEPPDLHTRSFIFHLVLHFAEWLNDAFCETRQKEEMSLKKLKMTQRLKQCFNLSCTPLGMGTGHFKEGAQRGLLTEGKLSFKTQAGKATQLMEWWSWFLLITGWKGVNPLPQARRNCLHHLFITGWAAATNGAGELGRVIGTFCRWMRLAFSIARWEVTSRS